jgi:hypothetical protein
MSTCSRNTHGAERADERLQSPGTSEHAFDRAFVRRVISPRDVCIPQKSIQAPPLLQFITNTCPGLLPFLLREVWRDDPVSIQKTEQPRGPGDGDGDNDGDRNDDGDGGGGRIHSRLAVTQDEGCELASWWCN